MNKVKLLPKAKKNKYRTIESYIFITLGLMLFAFAWMAFLIPAKIVGGGVSGIAALVFYATGFPLGITNLIINAALVLIAIKVLGARFGLNTIYGIIVLSVFFYILPHYFDKPIIQDQFMSAMIGAILSGFGIGFAFSHGGNSGGTDIVALIANKYYNISPGRVILYLDIVIIGSSILIFKSVDKLVYGYVVMAVFSYTIDMVLEGAKQSYQIMVFSEKSDSIADRVVSEVGRGATLLNGVGWYTQRDQKMLIVIARKHDKQPILRIINEEDEHAFISVAKVMGVFGQNFDKIKL